MVLVVDKVTVVVAAIGLLEPALASLLALEVLSLESGLAAVDLLATMSMLQVVNPLSIIGSILLSVFEDARSVGFALDPHSLVDISIDLLHATESSHLVVDKLAGVEGAVLHSQDADSVSDHRAISIAVPDPTRMSIKSKSN